MLHSRDKYCPLSRKAGSKALAGTPVAAPAAFTKTTSSDSLPIRLVRKSISFDGARDPITANEFNTSLAVC